MKKLRQTRTFDVWLRRLDSRTRGRVAARLRMMQEGNFGDSKSVGGGVHETRLHFGPGYRLYYTTRGSEVVWLLVGGDKGSQQADIALAQELAEEI